MQISWCVWAYQTSQIFKVVTQAINFLTELKVKADLFLEKKQMLCYLYFSYFAHFHGARDLGKSDLQGISGSSKHSIQDALVFVADCACSLADMLLRARGIYAPCRLARCAPKLSPVRRPFLCNAKSSLCCCVPATRGQPQPFVLQAALVPQG